MGWSEDSPPSIDHPIGHLAHAQPRCMTQLLLLVFARVRVIRMTMQPGFQKVCRLLGQLTAFPLRAIHERGAGYGRR
jgi:hypothetical protein